MPIDLGEIVFEEIYTYTDLISLREYMLLSWHVTYRDGGESPKRFSICEVTDGELRENQGMPL